MKKAILNAVMMFAIVAGLGTIVFAQPKTGGYKTVATDDAGVVAAAEFAVGKRVEENTEQEGMTLDSVDKAETQVVAGTNYRLCLTVKLEDESQQVQAVVYRNLKQEYSLTSWTVEDCGGNSSYKITVDDRKTLQSLSFGLPIFSIDSGWRQ